MAEANGTILPSILVFNICTNRTKTKMHTCTGEHTQGTHMYLRSFYLFVALSILVCMNSTDNLFTCHAGWAAGLLWRRPSSMSCRIFCFIQAVFWDSKIHYSAKLWAHNLPEVWSITDFPMWFFFLLHRKKWPHTCCTSQHLHVYKVSHSVFDLLWSALSVTKPLVPPNRDNTKEAPCLVCINTHWEQSCCGGNIDDTPCKNTQNACCVSVQINTMFCCFLWLTKWCFYLCFQSKKAWLASLL